MTPEHILVSAPRLRRLSNPVEQYPLYREFAMEGPLDRRNQQ
jgi:hypothetical protein